jgi:hypothetical protein
VIVSEGQLQQMAEANWRLKRVIVTMVSRLDENEQLLNIALHELAVAHRTDPPTFMRRWLKTQRGRLNDLEGVPLGTEI